MKRPKPSAIGPWGYLSDEVAGTAGLSLAELQQFCAGQVHPDDAALARLARRIGFTPPDPPGRLAGAGVTR
jgi:hypothetical protein